MIGSAHFIGKMAQASSFMERAPAQLVELLRQFIQFSEEQDLPPPLVTGFDRDPKFYEQNGLKVPAFSWHLVGCALDLRSIHYTEPQLKLVESWLTQHCTPSHDWELITKLHGTGPHIHVAYRDRRRRAGWLDAAMKPA